MYKRNKEETYAWLLCARNLPLPNEIVMRVCDYLFDKKELVFPNSMSYHNPTFFAWMVSKVNE